jgi:hypothetical protein
LKLAGNEPVRVFRAIDLNLSSEPVAGEEHSCLWRVPEKILWRDSASFDSLSVINKITISSSDHAICGLRFNYTSGYSRSFGLISHQTATFRIGDGEGLKQVAVGYYGGVVSSLEVSQLSHIHLCCVQVDWALVFQKRWSDIQFRWNSRGSDVQFRWNSRGSIHRILLAKFSRVFPNSRY